MTTIAIITLTLIFTGLSGVIDAEHFARGQYFNDHTSRFAQRCTFCLLAFFVGPTYFIISGLVFAFSFDFILNKIRGLEWFYIGGVSEMDKFFSKHRILYYFYKSLLLISIVICIKFLK